MQALPWYLIYVIFEIIFSSSASTFAIILLILQGLGMMKISKKVGVEKGWMGFIPYANGYLLGKLAEESDRRAYPDKEPRKWSKLMLGAEIGVFCLAIVFSVAVTVISVIFGFSLERYGDRAILPFVLSLVAAIIVFVVLLAAYVVLEALVIYRVCRMMAGKHAQWMLPLSLVVTGAFPVLLMIFGFSSKFPLNPMPWWSETPSA